jgi:hypothetical protein
MLVEMAQERKEPIPALLYNGKKYISNVALKPFFS